MSAIFTLEFKFFFLVPLRLSPGGSLPAGLRAPPLLTDLVNLELHAVEGGLPGKREWDAFFKLCLEERAEVSWV